jgi:hypothetical protein
MGLFGRGKTSQRPHEGGALRQAQHSGRKPPAMRPRLTREQLELSRLEECADRCGLDLDKNEELVRYIDQHIREGGNFVIKKLVNKRAIKSLTSAERTDFPTREMVEEWVSRGDGFGPGKYVVLPAGKNRILARYEVQEW